MKASIDALPVYPAALAASFVITRFLESVEPVQVLPRPLVVFVLAVVALQVVLSALGRNARIGGYFAAIVAMILADPTVGFLLLAAGTIPLILAAAGRRSVGARDWGHLTALLNLAAIGVLAFNVAGLAGRDAMASSRPTPVATPGPIVAVPDMYLLLLDGYPRADTLRTEFDFDNEPFLASMESMGFEVADRAYSNYNATILTLASMFNMRPAQEVVPGSPGHPEDERLLIRAINDASGLTKLRELGYRIVALPSGVAAFSLYGADQVEDTGQINSFEISVLRSGLLPLILPGLQNTIVHDSLRDRVTSSLDRVVELASAPSTGPRFVFAHIMSPHPPIVFGSDGSPREGWGCFPQGCEPFADNFVQDMREPTVGQVAHLNTLVLEAVSGLLAKTEGRAVILVFSDHGRRHDFGDRGEMLRSLFLSYTPGHPGLFPTDTSPVNILPRLLNAYAGTDIPFASEASYVLDLREALELGYFALTPWSP